MGVWGSRSLGYVSPVFIPPAAGKRLEGSTVWLTSLGGCSGDGSRDDFHAYWTVDCGLVRADKAAVDRNRYRTS